MRIYHGSTVAVRQPSLRYGRANTDFGKGFDTTTDMEQAARWALIRKERAKTGKAIVSVYEIDDAILADSILNIMQYHGATEEWLNFVVANRRGAPLHSFDIVLGPVANDRLYTTISMFENGELSVEAAIVQLNTHTLYDQVAFHTHKALSLVHFVKTIEV